MNNRENSASVQYQVFRKLAKELADGGNAASRTVTAIRDELTPRQMELVKLYYVDQHTMQEIADMLEVCPSTVCRTLQTARRNLKRCLKYGGTRLLHAEE